MKFLLLLLLLVIFLINNEFYEMQPDITAPGVDVLAAFSEVANPSDLDYDTRRTPFVFLSGTSMSCPHIGGIVGLLKTLNPSWSPAMIKSAIMTTGIYIMKTFFNFQVLTIYI